MKGKCAKLTWASALALIITLQVSGCVPGAPCLLTIAVEGAGGVFAPDPDQEGRVVPSTGGAFPQGTALVLTATADDGYRFVRWEGNLPPGCNAEDAQLEFTIDSDASITAVFAAVSAGHRSVTAAGVTCDMTLAVRGSTVKGVWRYRDVGTDVDGTISGDEVTLTCSSPLTNPATITATVGSGGSWSGSIDGSGFEHDPFTAAAVDLAGSGAGSPAVRTTLLPDYGASATGRVALVVEDGVIRGTWRMLGDLGADIEGTLTGDQFSLTVSTPGLSTATATGTVQWDDSWEGLLYGSGFEGEPFVFDPPFFP